MKQPQFTIYRFSAFVIAVMATYVALFSVLLFYPEPPRPVQFENINELFTDDPATIPAGLYLCFLMGWGIAYSVFFRFPRNFKVLLAGVFVGACILTFALMLGNGTESSWSEAPLPLQVLYTFLAASIGSAFQLLFLTGALQIFKSLCKKFFNRTSAAKKGV
ncbi:MAG: hypothetical protein AAFW83_14645 [Pseudomonadota bacterium]